MMIYIEIAAVLFIVYLGFGSILLYKQRSILYRPVRNVVYTPNELGLDYEEVTLTTADNVQISAWYTPAKGAELTILFCHANSGNIMHRMDSINLFNNMGLNCLIFDYRGYGNSKGKPSEEGTYSDAAAAYRWLTETKNISAENIIIFGKSLGSSIAAQLASKVRAQALVLEGAFTSYVDIGKKFYPYLPVRLFARYSYPTIDYIKEIDMPVMIIHSQNDEIVPFELGEKLYEQANEPKEFVEIYGKHNDGFLVSSDLYKKAWTRWLRFLKQSKTPSSQHQAS